MEKQPPKHPAQDKTNKTESRIPLGLKAGASVLFGFAFYAALFFGAAGTFDYWEAWALLGTLFVPGMLASLYFARADPELMERRMRMREERPRQRIIMRFFMGCWLLIFVMAGMDRRFEGSSVPAWLVILADVGVLASYGFVIRVMLENRYAARTIGVEEGQELVTTGLYALVRHPMYLGLLPMAFLMPLALGSWWAAVPALVLPLFLVLRILDEEEVLMEGLPGYVDYMQQTKRRLIPGVW